MSSLQALELYSPLPRAGELILNLSLRLSRLDVDFTGWPGPDSDWQLPCLSSLVLRGVVLRGVVVTDLDRIRLASLSRCPALRNLVLVGNHVHKIPVDLIPSGLETLELVGFWPSRPVSIRTVWLEQDSFDCMSPDAQAQMRTGIKNLYVVSSLRNVH
jgi:hypothetical protein